ncbi:O-antigen ligase family protein [Paenibacillus pasadenensis]|uniref:O-antigen ligase family protein n=1 Tax=Paenibacillus pasadenensis TaxID=217090 RepID=UPI00203EA853|nr:O-antigen ligase family protein [Paenibacillus pasadenensis]MCM3748301.1 O-antigen ligase family protein [Paenibacillus pasadenensis]
MQKPSLEFNGVWKRYNLIAGAAALGAAVLLASVFRRAGWFFDRDGDGIALLLGVLGIITLVIKGWQHRRESRLDAADIYVMGGLSSTVSAPGELVRHRPFRAMDAAAFCCFGLALMYTAGLLAEPVSPEGNVQEALRWAAYGSFGLLLAGWQAMQSKLLQASGSGRRRSSTEKLPAAASDAAAWGVQLFTLYAVGSSLAVWLGWIGGTDYMLRTGDIRLSSAAARLAGYVQYSNTLGAIAAALLVWQWLLQQLSRSRLLRISGALLAAPCLTVLLLTESRGALLVLLAAAAGGVLLAPRGSRLNWAGRVAWTFPGAIAAAAMAWSWEAGGGADNGAGQNIAAVLMAGLLYASSAVLLIQTSLHSTHSAAAGMKRMQSVIGILLAFTALRTVAYSWSSARFNPGEEEALATGMSRLSMYKDGWHAAGDSWLLGYGARAWELLRGSLPSAPHASTEIHNGYLDMLLTGGAVGLLLLAGLGVLLMREAGAKSRLGMLPPFVLLLHAAIDVDMCFGIFWLLLFVLAAAGSGLEMTAEQSKTGEASPRFSRRTHPEMLDAVAPDQLPTAPRFRR